MINSDPGFAYLLRCFAVSILLLFNQSALSAVSSHQKISTISGGFTGTLDDGDLFGWVPEPLGDLDGDGISELVVGTPGDDDGGTDRGALWILFINSDGTVKNHLKISDTEGNFTGTLSDGDGFGHSVAPIGDFDNDGNNDLAVGALGDDEGAPGRGALWLLFLNADGSVKSHVKITDIDGGFTASSPQEDGFGHGISRIGDLDNDGIADLATATGHNAHVGVIWIMFMNADGTVKSHQRINDTEGNFTGAVDADAELGHDLAGLGDLDGDGVLDIAAGLRHEDDGGNDRGGLFILFMNTDGTVKAHQKITQTQGGFSGALSDGDVFGHPPSNAGDLDGDGVIDLLVGAPFDDDGALNVGAFWILYLNNDGTVKAQEKISQTQGGFTGTLSEDDLFAHIVTAMGDINGDGITDFAVGAPHDDDGGSERGAVWIMFSSGPDVGNSAPTAGFSFTSSALQVDFTDTSTDNEGSIVAWDWDFGDGNTSTAQNPSHTYSSANTYTVTLTVTDEGSLGDSISQSVSVGQSNLSASVSSLDFGPQLIGTTSDPQAVTLNNTGTDPIDVTTILIQGNDAAEFDHDAMTPITLPGSGQSTFNVTFTPTSISGGAAGALYRINAGGPVLSSIDADRLDWAVDTAGNPSPFVNSATLAASFTGSFTLDASVPAGAPPALFNTYRRQASTSSPNMAWDLPVTAGEPIEVRLFFIQFKGCSAGSKVIDVQLEGAVVLDNYDVITDVGCNVGVMKSFMITPADGNLDIDLVRIQGGPPLVSAIEIVGNGAGTKTAQVLVEHTGSNPSLNVDLNGQGTAGNAPPTAAFGFVPNALQVAFNDTSDDSDGNIVAWDWDFGDGNSSTAQNPTHNYISANTYTVTLTVTDNGGETGSVSQSVTVQEPGAGGDALYRVNAGGPVLSSIDSDPLDWAVDTAGSPSPFVNGSETFTGSFSGTLSLDSSVPAGTPAALFNDYRREAGTTTPAMVWDFPVTAGVPVEVRLFFMQFKSCSAGTKIIDVSIEGTVILDNYDVIADVGCNVGVMKSIVVTPADSNLDIDFTRIQGGPPLISGIEIVDAGL